MEGENIKKITIYTSDTCPYCQMMKDYLNEKNVDFDEKNITKNPQERRVLIENEIMGVPAAFIGDEIVLGFDKEKIDELLGL